MKLSRPDVPPIYALTDPASNLERVDLVMQLVACGIEWIQVREKNLSDADLYRVVASCASSVPAHVRIFVNDRADVALAAKAHGVHVGEDDVPPSAVRAAAGDRPLLIGYSTHSLGEAVDADANPAIDYVAIGPIFPSLTKNVREPLGVAAIADLRERITKPIVAIGGIDATNIGSVLHAGADCAAVIAALYGGGPLAENVKRLMEAASRWL